ncbi:MAG TPA: glucose 1-dehydrogenase [Bacteroidia bacterium]|nr:glucose 1-dehydrogenase [Bacteroidia bacterium]
MQRGGHKRKVRSEPRQKKPGSEANMNLPPEFDSETAGPGKKLENKVALITGGDSGIGRAVAVLFAKHGADVAITHLKVEAGDAKLTRDFVMAYGRQCLLIQGDISSEKHCISAVRKTLLAFGQLDILVNNAGIHYKQKSITGITAKQLKRTFEVNVFSMFYLVKAALKHLKSGASIINTSSVTAYRGSAELLDYAATKGAIVSFTRSLSASLNKNGIRVNCVAPGPVWTPLIVSAMSEKDISTFGTDSPMGRVGQPSEIAPCFLFLASEESSFISGQVLHPNGGEVING